MTKTMVKAPMERKWKHLLVHGFILLLSLREFISLGKPFP